MDTQIRELKAREVLDSRGNPTIEVELCLADGSAGRAMVPSGASKGEHEALELRDGDPKRFLGRGTLKAVKNVNETIGKAVHGRNFSGLSALDRFLLALDGTPQKSNLGANAILGVSLAFAHALAASAKRPLYLEFQELMGVKSSDMKLPVPLMNILNGGLHANNGLEIQEFMIVPHGFPTFREALRAGCEVFQNLKNILHDEGKSVAVGDEGGFAPELRDNRQALEYICKAVEKSKYKLGSEVALALDVAASSFFEKSNLRYKFGGKEVGREELIEYYGGLLREFPLVSIEDGLDENDWAGWKELTKSFSAKTQLVGDDLFVTQVAKVRQGIENQIANAVLIKVNQIGSLTETFDTMALCRKSQYNAVVSHRSGETEDVTIAHLAVGSGCGQIKTGSLSRGERTAKYNELLRIEEWAETHGGALPYSSPFKA